MNRNISSIIEYGLSGTIVQIECHISNGLPAIVIVGSANRSIEEAKERLRGAFSSSGLQLPRKRITINLAPGDIPKSGAGFDLAIAAAILVGQDGGTGRRGLVGGAAPPTDRQIYIGELSLDGSVLPVRGIIGKLLAAHQLGYRQFVIPTGNLTQAQLVPGLQLLPVSNLSQLRQHLDGSLQPRPHPRSRWPADSQQRHKDSGYHDLTEVSGQALAKRALEIAAAGGHNILLCGPPGGGKSMLARALPTILPPLNQHEILETTHLHSLASQKYDQLIINRPFRAPHHTISDKALVGGGSQTRPGEISLSHHGVLFLDELAEFKRSALEALRQPLEDGVISISRAQSSVEYPANFILVATTNPCPCGLFGTNKACTCSAYLKNRYQQRLSGPIMDRIDLQINTTTVNFKDFRPTSNPEEPSAVVAKRVLRARKIQTLRQNGQLNANLSNQGVKKYAPLQPEPRQLLEKAAQKLGLSARGYIKIIKISRTIADLAQSKQISTSHICEALQYRHQRPA